MADQDKASKTEEATPRKRSEAARKGDFPKSQEFKSWIILATALVLLTFYGDTVGTGLKEALGGYLGTFSQVEMTGPSIVKAIQGLGGQILLVLAVPLIAFIIAAFAGTLLQHKPALSAEQIKPKLEKIDPIKGLQKKFSTNNLVDFAKSVAKLVIVSAAAVITLWPDIGVIEKLTMMTVPQLLETLWHLVFKMLLTVVVILTLIAWLDLMWQRHQHNEKLKMTKQEVKDERKQMEGDPEVKRRLARLRAERSRRRMMAAVPESDVVITNPTHYAVALKYNHGSMNAPVLVAKGVDAVAFRIRTLAEDHDIPIVENPPLARSLHATVELDEEIQPEHYKAVAEVIGYVMRLRRGVQGLARAGAA